MNDLTTAGISPVDVVVIVVYLIGITALGIWTSKSVGSMSDFFMPHRFGVWSMVMHAFGTGTASDQAVTVASSTAQKGLSGIWWQWLWLIPTPFYWLMAPILRRFRAVTTADILTLRFDSSVAVLFAVVGILSMTVKIGVMLKGAGALFAAGSSDLIPANTAIAVITVLFVLYGTAGGLGAAIVTDFVQGVLTLVFSFLLLPFVLQAVGGIAGIRETIQSTDMLSLATPGEISLFFVVMMGVQALAGIISQPHVLGACSAGKTEWEGRAGFMVGNLVKRVCTIAWCMTAIAAVAWYLDQGMTLDEIRTKEFGDRIYGSIAREFLPNIMPGLLGVFLASLLASVMSSCDSFMVASSALFTENIYRPANPGWSDRHYLWVGRVVGLFVVLGGLLFALKVGGVVEALKIWFQIAPMTGIALWMSLFWRRMTVLGAWATTLSGFTALWLTTRSFFINWVATLSFAESLGLITNGKIYVPWQILFYMMIATSAGIVVSLMTKRVATEKLDLFHALMRTPISPEEEVVAPCTLPVGVEPPDRRMLIQGGGIEVPMPSMVSLAGFVAGAGAAVAMVVAFKWLFS